jgi:polysaccharide biosynthesis protein VpsM
MKKSTIAALRAVGVAAALSTSGASFGQGPSVPAAGGAGPGTATPDAVSQPGPVDSVTREEFRGDPFSLSAPAANPFGSVQSGIPSGIPSAETGAAGLRLGPGTLYPALGLNLRHDDNIFLSDANKKSSFISVLTPIVRYEMRSRNATYDLIYKGDYANYWDSSADNYDDHQAIARANWAISGRANARLSAEYFRSHDPRGSTDRTTSNEPDVFDAKSLSGLFGYGTPGARGRIEVEGGVLEKRYKNNRAATIFADRDVAYGAATFYWRVMPKTSLLFQVRDTELDYKVDTTALDSSELRFLVGATWEATAKTTGTFRIGQVRKDFDSSTRQDFTGIGWEGTVSWSPLTYSTITFSTAREPTESSGTGDFILAQIYYLTWSHAWTERIISAVSAGYRTDDFRGAAATRSDDTSTAGLRLTYRMRRWLSLSGEYTYTDRQSNAPLVDYSRNVFMLSLGATL